MAKAKKSWNPLAFLPLQVSILGTVVYVALFAVLIWIHESVPSAPSNPTPFNGINLTQAWLDLEYLTDGYHPWSSRRNEEVREYLLGRIDEILQQNGVEYKTVHAGATGNSFVSDGISGVKPVTVFANDTANFTSRDDWRDTPLTLYGESSNLYVYLRGQDDQDGEWWNSTTLYKGASGVLVNAHYDSVSSGFGATDDGMGVVTVLQLISYFTSKGNRPTRRGIVAMLNNGEEVGLFGARNYVNHALAQFPHTFLNLEGAGAGGRAILFRSTDAEVTSAYSRSPYPFGTVVTDDGFKRGLVRSGTDFSVFTERLGLRGLDVAFFRPRARYHTDQDDARDTSPDSLWHMLSSSLATVENLASYRGDEYEGSMSENGKMDTGAGSSGVWFDMLGRGFAVMRVNTHFALSVTLLVVGPLALILVEVLLRRQDKWYPFAGKKFLRSNSGDSNDSVRLHGRRGFFRFLLAFVVATVVVFALAYLQVKVNPYLIYSSEYAIWAMLLSAWFAVSWFFFAGAANVRPTALQRMFALLWVYLISWILLVAATVGEKNFGLGGGYFLLIYNAAAFLALLTSYLELSALPTMTKYVEHVQGAQAEDNSASQSEERGRTSNDNDEPTERTSLLGNNENLTNQTFTRITRRRPERDEVPENADDALLNKAYANEQAWSSSLPSWTWIIQFIILVPINVIIIGQIALLVTSSLHQTPADGNEALPIYLFLALLTILLLLPLSPFLHRFSYHVPTFLLLVFVGCLIYNMIAFPFSRDARLKYYFVQDVNLDTGINTVSLSGIDGYLQDIIGEMPSASGQPVECRNSTNSSRQAGLQYCQWQGLDPNVVPSDYLAANSATSLRKEKKEKPITYRDWLSYKTSHPTGGNSATFTFQGLNTKMCLLKFDNYVSDVRVKDGEVDSRTSPPVKKGGSNQVLLLSRTWDKVFSVNVTWADGIEVKGQKGKVMCYWADANQRGVIPAFDELQRFQPVWSAVTKSSFGLVEGWKEFEI